VFDINHKGTSHDTLRLSPEESKSIDRLISYLKWEHDLTIKKNDVCRVAIHYLMENFQAEVKASEAVTRLKKKSR
jgi:hypothetical protein